MDQEPPDDREPPPEEFGDFGDVRPIGHQPSDVLVFRNNVGDPIAVPDDVVTEAERAFRCHKLRVKGKSWEEIADLEMYPSAEACHADVKRYIEEGRALVVERTQREMISLEVARLDALQALLWDKAEEGSIVAIGEIRKIIMSRVQVTGQDPTKAVDDAAAQGRTVVLTPAEGGTDDGFIGYMKRAAGETDGDASA